MGKLVIYKLADGRTGFGRLKRGYDPDHYNIISFNSPMIENVRLEWCTRVMAIVPE